MRRELQHGGRPRVYYVHLPPQAAEGAPLPVVLNFHGGGGDAPGQECYSGMDALADEEGFIVVYPNGTSRFGEQLLTWNAGGCCGYAQDESVDDVGFVRAMIEDLAALAPIDRARIYATGLSNGAMMAYRLGAEAGDLVAAIAPVAGAMKLEAFAPIRRMPILHIHSVDDPRALYDGGTGPPFPLTNRQVDHEAVESVLALWAAFDGCPSEPVLTSALSGEPGTTNEGQTAEWWVYAPCSDGVEVDLWKLTGAGHVWPGGTPDYLTTVLGPSTSIIDANREMWTFFRRFALEMNP
jgi:polyhydroxybutyrate depolymerase